MRMTPLIAVLAATVAACGGGGGDGTPTSPTTPTTPTTPGGPVGATATVVASSAGTTFDPEQVTITRNGSVPWSFGELTHNVNFGSTAGAPANIGNTTNAQVSRTFATAGTFPYRCTLHSGMTGSVVVQ